MTRTAGLILGFIIGFYGSALITDRDAEMLVIKSYVMLGGVIIALILLIIDFVKQKQYA